MQSVDDKAMTYFQSLPATDVTDEASPQRAKALEKIGSVRMDQGHLPTAMESFRASARLCRHLPTPRPTSVARQTAYARILAFIGLGDWYLGNLTPPSNHSNRRGARCIGPNQRPQRIPT